MHFFSFFSVPLINVFLLFYHNILNSLKGVNYLNKKDLREFFLLFCMILSFFTFCFLVLVNRIAFILENPTFVFEQEEPIRKWMESNNELVNFVTFAPLGFSILFLLIFIWLISKDNILKKD